jgi:hypothetical protein
MQSADIGGTDVHTGALSHRLQSFKDLNLRSAVVLLVSHNGKSQTSFSEGEYAEIVAKLDLRTKGRDY